MKKTKLIVVGFIAFILASCGVLPQPYSELENNVDTMVDVDYYETSDETVCEATRMLIEHMGEERVDNQRRSLALLDEMNVDAHYIGGVYLDDTGRLTVLIAASYAEAAQGFLAELDDWVLVRKVGFSEQELNEVVALLIDAGNVWEFAVGFGIDTVRNNVAVDLIRYSEAEIARFREEVLDSPMVTFRNPRAVPPERLISQPLRVYPALDGGVVMYSTQQTENSVTVEIRNNTEFPLTTGYSYVLEFYSDGIWRVIPGVGFFVSLGLGIEPGGTLDFTKCLKDYLHLPLAPGLYRIRKDVMINTWQTEMGADGRPLRFPADTLHDVVAEFNW